LDEKKLLTVAEAARILNLGRSHTYAYVLKGEIESFKIGKSRRIPVEAIDAFIARLRSEVSDA
jgi:excisionase family DNA binding protein